MTLRRARFPLAAIACAVTGILFTALPSTAMAADRDCSDFSSQRAAQIFFLKHGGPQRDSHRLDADDDGVACESNPCPCYRKKRLPRFAKREFVIGPRSQSR